MRCIEASLEHIDLAVMSIECTPLVGAQSENYEMMERIDSTARQLKSQVVVGGQAVKQTVCNAGLWTL